MRPLPRTPIVIAMILTARLPATQPPAESSEKLLEAAIYRAKVLGDLPGAIQQFESIVTRYAGQPAAARALVEVGQAEEKLGHPRRARAAYQRVVREYPDQIAMMTQARRNPESLDDAPPTAQGVSWVSPRLPVSPSPRCCMGLAYDRATHSALMFGGFNPFVCFGDTWVWRNGWRQLSPATAPSARTAPGMVYDGAAGDVVLFGGYDSNGTTLNDTWTWDGATWTQRFPPLSPPARQLDAHSMAYDAAARKVVLFGGTQGRHALGDTWTWDGQAKTWTQQFPASSPSPRRTMMVYDEATKTIVLFGGDAGGILPKDTFYNDTWIWGGTTWIQRSPASAPSARGMAALAYDSNLGSVVLFGGVTGPGGQSNDTWLWNGTNWKEIRPATVPAARWNAGMDYDPIENELLLFGGFSSTALGDTWIFSKAP
ncbi:MAG: kelch repeat-containing protein [Bryobacteraceae bacterium]|jgi:hypothetical protein